MFTAGETGEFEQESLLMEEIPEEMRSLSRD
jgi:hypothetical protein